MAIYREFLTNDKGSVKGSAFEPIERFKVSLAGNITADAQYVLFVCPAGMSGRIVEVLGGALEAGADGTDAMNMEYEFLKNATNVCTTDPTITQNPTAAGTGIKSTYATATGITPGVLKTDTTPDFTAGDVISVNFNITRTTPDTEMAGVFAQVGVKWYRATS